MELFITKIDLPTANGKNGIMIIYTEFGFLFVTPYIKSDSSTVANALLSVIWLSPCTKINIHGATDSFLQNITQIFENKNFDIKIIACFSDPIDYYTLKLQEKLSVLYPIFWPSRMATAAKFLNEQLRNKICMDENQKKIRIEIPNIIICNIMENLSEIFTAFCVKRQSSTVN